MSLYLFLKKKMANNIDKLNNSKGKELIDEETQFNFFNYFYVHINDLWNYFINSSFVSSNFYENCEIINIKNLENTIKENDILELKFKDRSQNVKIKIEDIIDTPNYKSFTHKYIDIPENISPFSIIISFYLSSVHQFTGVNIKFEFLNPDMNKGNFIYEYIYKNHMKIFQNIEKFIEKNFKEYEQSESICIEKNIEEVLTFLTKDNYNNLKILLGNNASVRSAIKPNEIEIEHFTKNTTVKMIVSKKKDYNEENLNLQIISSSKNIPKQNISIKIININNNSCLFFLTHKIKQFLSSEKINNYSIIKQKTLWFLKSTLENNINI